jgi:hypothetical protein
MPLQKSTILSHPYVTTFLETGTFHGGGVTRALSEGYRKVISIEIHEPLYCDNLSRFSSQIDDGNVSLHLGDSGHIIGDIVSSIDEPILFWFDAHDQTMNDAGVGDCKCPIVKELKSIMSSRSAAMRRLDILVIDDMRLIENPGAGWDVNVGDLYNAIWDYNRDFALTREDGHINHDILYCKNRYMV